MAGIDGRIATEALSAALALVPVVLFLASLVWLDSYKLVRFRGIAALIAAGAAAAIASWIVNHAVAGWIDPLLLRRWVAPLVEEVLKAAPVLYLLRRRRIGFLVDAVIFGYAVGTGFAVVENAYYLWALPDASLLLWLVRGVGTAVMHGATTSIVAVAAVAIQGRHDSDSIAVAAPGLGAAIAVHAAFNHFIISPLLSALLMMMVLPPLLVVAFAKSEEYLRRWLGNGFDLDADLLRLMGSGEFGDSSPGRYLATLRERFAGPAVADMLCYLRLQAELSLQAKGVLMMRECGFEPKVDPTLPAKLEEVRFLERSIGRTGLLAMRPILRRTRHDLWQLQLLGQ